MRIKEITRVKTNHLLETAIDVAEKWEADLGEGEEKGKAQKAFEAMRNGSIKIDNPQAFLQKPRMEDFEALGMEVAPDIEKTLSGRDGHAFYILPAPVLLFPGRGAQYRLLESHFAFDAGLEKHPMGIRNVFPKPMWRPVLEFGGNFNLGLDSELNWTAGLENVEADVSMFDGELSGRVKSGGELGGFLNVTPFEYTLGRMDIEARFSSSTAAWRFDSEDAIRNQGNVQFIFLLKIPEQASRIKVEAAVQAEPSFHWLVAQIQHVFERLPRTIQDIVKGRKGLPLQYFAEWTLDLP